MAKFIIVVMDSVGIGALPDAYLFGDEGSDTLGHIIEAYPDIKLNNLGRLGLCLLKDLPCSTGIIGAYGRAAEKFPGKDTTGGHFEIAGLVLDKPFPTFPDGFPKDFMEAFEAAIGRKTIGNYPASGTEIIQKLGDEHVKTGWPIVYTSADSVFQIAMHEDVIPLDKQYEICRKAREMLTGPLAVGRVICRPFIGTSGNYTRTKNRRDFSFEPPGETILTAVKDAGLEVAGVGKIEDIFAGVGLTKTNHTTDNDAGITATVEYIRQDFDGLVFTNLVDFDMVYGHRNNVEGYKNALEALDARVPEILAAMRPADIVVFTADHGCDPTTTSTDHSREYIPILCWGNRVIPRTNIGTRQTFADIAATAAEFFGLDHRRFGTSFYKEITGGKSS
ncbi:MAG: phosphopentomutase [Christensenellales bacterium]|jgi:phosphopentomutase